MSKYDFQNSQLVLQDPKYQSYSEDEKTIVTPNELTDGDEKLVQLNETHTKAAMFEKENKRLNPIDKAHIISFRSDEKSSSNPTNVPMDSKVILFICLSLN